MTLTHCILAVAFLALLAGVPAAMAQTQKKPAAYGDPTRLEKAITAFEGGDAKERPPEGAIVCTGSSSILHWHGTIKQDLAPLTVIPRGLSGSTMNDLLHYADRIVIAYKPRAVFVYEGSNDINAGIAPELVAAAFTSFVARVHAKLPQTRIYVLSINPSPRRWALWPKMQAANALIKAFCDHHPLLTYIDVSARMLDETGRPRPDLYQPDALHLVRKGYELWRDAVRPVLLEAEGKHEQPATGARARETLAQAGLLGTRATAMAGANPDAIDLGSSWGPPPMRS